MAKEEIGEYLYFFRSPTANCSHVLVLGHAGWVPRLGNTFTIPAGVTLNFRSWHGQPNTSNPVREIINPRPRFDRDVAVINAAPGKAATMLVATHEKKDYVAGDTCHNYVLIKGVGKHWDKKNPKETSYTEIAKMVELAAGIGQQVHFVTIRNRRFSGAEKYVLLSDVIAQVKAHMTGIPSVNFVMAGCRGINPNWTP